MKPLCYINTKICYVLAIWKSMSVTHLLLTNYIEIRHLLPKQASLLPSNYWHFEVTWSATSIWRHMLRHLNTWQMAISSVLRKICLLPRQWGVISVGLGVWWLNSYRKQMSLVKHSTNQCSFHFSEIKVSTVPERVKSALTIFYPTYM